MVFSLTGIVSLTLAEDVDLSVYTRDELIVLRDRINELLMSENYDSLWAEEFVLFEDENFKVSYVDLIENFSGDDRHWYEVQLLVENKTDGIIHFSINDILINGCAVRISAGRDCSKNSKALCKCSFDYDELAVYGIQKFETFSVFCEYFPEGQSSSRVKIQTDPIIYP